MSDLGNPLVMATAAKTVSNDKWLPRILVGSAIGLVAWGVYRVSSTTDSALETVGLKDSAQDKANKKAIAKVTNGAFWSPSYYRGVGRHFNLTDKAAKIAADRIHDAWGVFNDDEEEVIGVIRALRSKAHISKVAHFYLAVHKTDLFGDLKSNLSDSELAIIAQWVDRLPNFIKP